MLIICLIIFTPYLLWFIISVINPKFLCYKFDSHSKLKDIKEVDITNQRSDAPIGSRYAKIGTCVHCGKIIRID